MGLIYELEGRRVNELLRELEMERQKLNELGKLSLEQSIPLSGNHMLLEQSRKVDELMVRYHHMKIKYEQSAP
ncbi:Uncharacterised protein [Actinobacillus pleuropneumoniae]|nr:Uncharacterised protein [Actinobacillus pleuropneumoniae]